LSTTYQPPAPPVDKDVHGQLVGVETRNAGWMRFLILEPGNQYPYKADTKNDEVIAAAMTLMNQAVSARVREQESTEINPHSGKPYMNRWLNAIAPQGYVQQNVPSGQVYPDPRFQQQVQQPMQQAPQPQQPQQPAQVPVQPAISGYDKDINIMRQCASKCATMMLSTLPEEQRTIPGLIAAAEAWMAYYIYGPLRFNVQPFSSPDGQQGIPPGGSLRAAQAAEEPVEQPCPDCGFTGTHALGCPRNEYAQ
jgi:hypothetical protein